MASQTAQLKLPFTTVDVFTSTRFKGNPLAIVHVPAEQAGRLTQEQKQTTAREFNLSETVFLHLPAEKGDATDTGDVVDELTVDIFTIESELPFAGHPTIGTAWHVLRSLGWSHVKTLRTKAGPIAIEPVSSAPGSQVRASIPHATHMHRQTLRSISESEPASRAVIEAALSDDAVLRDAELDAPVFSIVRGMTFLLVRLPTVEHLSRISLGRRLDTAKLTGTASLTDEGPWRESFVSRYYYAVTDVGDDGGVRRWSIRTRMVELGFEDPATGSAACTLAAYLAGQRRAGGTGMGGKHVFEVTQGVEMGRKSDISVEVVTGPVDAEDGSTAIREVFLGGEAVEVMTGNITI